MTQDTWDTSRQLLVTQDSFLTHQVGTLTVFYLLHNTFKVALKYVFSDFMLFENILTT